MFMSVLFLSPLPPQKKLKKINCIPSWSEIDYNQVNQKKFQVFRSNTIFTFYFINSNALERMLFKEINS